MSNCIFCDIVAGAAEATVVYQDDLVTAFMDLKPINAGHMDVVPNAHATGLADLPAETGAHMFRVAKTLAAALRASDLACEGVNLFLADGRAAMQEVFHVHLHAIPRRTGDGFGLAFGPGYRQRGRAELDAAGESIRNALATKE